MIVSRIDGGLGNQMFQYAYGYCLAKKHSTSLLLDTNSYDSQPQHGYLLDRFQISASVLSAADQRRIPQRYRSQPGQGLSSYLQRLLSWGVLPRHKEAKFGFTEKHLQVANNRYLVGYWQSEKFFPGLRDDLLAQFKPRKPLSNTSRRMLDRIQATNSIAVHVRRGDYVTSKAAAKIYCNLPTNYYTSAIHTWAAKQVRPEVFVFSNDIPWCRQQFSLPYPVTFVDHNQALTAHEDMVLMSQAKCCVIANSTFSWWAAWLNEREEKAVYAPPNWFHAGTIDGSSIIPESWQVVPSLTPQQTAA
jgi:hypothetical protein